MSSGTIDAISSNVEEELRQKGFDNLSFIIAVDATGNVRPFRAPKVEVQELTDEQDQRLDADFIGRLKAIALVHFEGPDGCIKYKEGGSMLKFGC
jgi:hypothetical protein